MKESITSEDGNRNFSRLKKHFNIGTKKKQWRLKELRHDFQKLIKLRTNYLYNSFFFSSLNISKIKQVIVIHFFLYFNN